MSIIPEKKEEFDVSPSIVELDQQRRKERQIEGFRLGAPPAKPLKNMTLTERIKYQQMEMMLNLQKINDVNSLLSDKNQNQDEDV